MLAPGARVPASDGVPVAPAAMANVAPVASGLPTDQLVEVAPVLASVKIARPDAHDGAPMVSEPTACGCVVTWDEGAVATVLVAVGLVAAEVGSSRVAKESQPGACLVVTGTVIPMPASTPMSSSTA